MYVHINDGLGYVASKLEAEKAVCQVKQDLINLGLITSEEKCVWKPTQLLVKCGLNLNTKDFTVSVTERKVARLKLLAKDLLGKKSVTVRELHAVTGLVISCTPALAGWPGSGPCSP